MNPVPIGVPGELYLGGDGLARGYLHRPELTAERFVPDPLHLEGTLYRTGDKVRYRCDGAIEYLGRFDHQVKLRGFRIELGEIESVLLRQQVVSDAMVIVHEEEPGEKRLVAYVVADSSDAPSVVDLRDFVANSLPNYMVPSAFMVIDKLPLTANGKVDRKALPEPGEVRASLGAEYTAPRTELEQQLAQIWAEVLKLERVGVHDNFFDLGGHSLMATQVVSRIRVQLNAELPLSELFEHPAVAELATVLELLLHENDGEKAEAIPVVDREGNLPLSFAQERLWFLDQLEPGGTAYNMSLALRLKGELNVAALENSLNAVISRQEGLRTHFATHQGKPIQVIEDAEIELPQEDLSALPSETLEGEFKTRLDVEALQPFDLDKGPLLRVRLLRFSDQEHVLLLTMHHIISDGWSLGVLFRELGECYAAYSGFKQPELAEVPIQYVDFAVWQREWLSGEVLASQMDYWRENLQGLSTLNLPTDRPRPAVQTYAGSSERITLDAELSKQLTSLSRQAGVTLFMTMLSGFAVLMHRYSGQEDIVVGTPIANRNRSETEGLIGFFVNSLVMRTDVSGSPGFRELVQRVNRTALDAFEHQDLPFEKLVDEIQPVRDLSHNPLFQVMFALQNAPRESLDLKGLTLESISREIKVSGFDLECHVWERGDRLEVIFIYNTDLFDASTIRRMMTHYRRLLEASTASPETPVGQLEILDDEEKQVMLHQWNQTRADYVKNETLHSLFEQQVKRTPHAIAVRFEQQSVDYSELDQKANDVACFLLAKNVEPGQLVGIYIERSINLVVAILGILKAGAAYVPLDTENPADRINYILQDANIRILLSQQKLEQRLPASVAEIINVDDSNQLANAMPKALPPVSADMLAYVIYTSGSTGRPKGVMVAHGAVVNHEHWMRDYFDIDHNDRVLQKSPINFDASVSEIFLPLVFGGCIVMASSGGDKDSAYLIQEIRDHKVTALVLVPSALRMLLRGLNDPADIGTLKFVGCGGEELAPDLQRNYYEKCSAPLYNMYGPTESTIDATCYFCTADFDGDKIPIGTPIANAWACILDPLLQPVPIGVQGELHLGGSGLARGYLNQPELTAEKFIADPFSDDPRARLYKTGDLARYRADGNIEFLGRTDHQVQLRGFRVEPGEIESALVSDDRVQDALVMVREDRPGDQRLVAYLATSDDNAALPAELRTYLRTRLPDYMIPAEFVVLDQFPLNASGKIDRKALPTPKGERQVEAAFVEPRSDLERQLVEIWREILKLERIGIHDDFFDLGGHSLMATQVVSRIRGQLNVELPLSEMFGYPTVAELALVVESLRDEGGVEEANVIPVADRDGDLPLSFAQERLWFLDQLEPGSTAYYMPLALRLEGELSVTALEDSLNAIVDRQEGLRTHFTQHQGKPFQIIEDATIKLVQEDLSALSSVTLEDEVKTRLDAEALQPFDLNAGPLLRCRLLRLSDHEHVLLLTIHHVISDGWSLGVLFRELGACYGAFSRGEQPVLAELPIQYADFAVWQREWLSGEVLASQMAYWREKLDDLSTLNLPTDRPRPAVQTYAGSGEKMALDAELSQQLKSLSRQAGVTLFMTLLGAFAVLMHRYSGQDDVVIGSPIANRNRSELEDLIGFFVNSLVMRTDVSGDPSFRELVQRVNRTALDAYEHQDLPFEKLVDEIQPDRDLSHNPLFQVMFALQNAPAESLDLRGLTLESISREIKVSGFDLECHVWEKGDRLEVVFVYNSDLFDASTIRQMMTHYRRLLEASVASPETPVGQLEILDDEEKQLMLHQWNQTRVDYVENETLHSLFEQQAKRTPQAIAVRFEQQSFDYAELERKANGLACLLLAKNVEPGQLVGVYLERSIDLVVAVLGILKASAAYVPLDPEYPEAHTNYVVADSNIRVLLSQKKFENQTPSAVTDVIYLDSGELYENVNPQTLPVVTEDMLAYVIYTSGSTGKPKGVAVPHRAACNHMLWMQETFPLSESDKVLQKTPYSFDASVWEFFAPLIAGAQLVMARPQEHKDPACLAETIAAQGITRIQLVPSLLKVLEEEDLLADCDSLRHVFCGGEALSVELQARFFDSHPADLINLYGPTEATIDATCWRCDRAHEGRVVPIGRPIANNEVYLLDRYRQPVPVGVPGEIYIGGAGLARGYLHRPELTAERFIDHPFSERSGARLYRTGDLGRYSADGNIEFIGRIDHQVKVRGFRIELGEIEAVLSQHEFIKACTALIYEDLQGNKNIAAYFVSDSSLSTLSLRNFLRKKLPYYMIPTLLTKLDEIPATPNGKTDYKTLASYTKGKTIRDSIYLPPETPAEKKIVDIWETLLNVDRVGVGDNFFDIGGHSLLLIQAKFIIEKEVGVSVPVMDFFHQTLGQIATYCEKNLPPEMSMVEV